jgi:putative transposase
LGAGADIGWKLDAGASSSISHSSSAVEGLGNKSCRGRLTLIVTGGWLSQYIFETIEEAQNQATEWLWTYNNERPNMGIGGITPAMKLKTAA